MSQQTSPPSTPAAGQATKGNAPASQPPLTPVASQAARDALAKGRAQVATNPSLSVAIQNIGPGSVQSSQRKARLALRASTPQLQPQQRQPLPPVPSLRATPHPDDPVQCQHQLGMLNAFHSFGRLGLSKFIYQEARDRATDQATEHYSWSLLADDEEKEKFVYQLLHLLPDQVITSLIRNTLALDARTNPEVKRFVDSEMKPREMSPMAGIYINITRRSNLILPPQVDPHAGKWMTPTQVKSLVDKVRAYVANEDDLQSLSTNMSIDNAVSRFSPSHLTERRFPLGSSSYRGRVLEWVKIIERQYWTNIDPSYLDIPFRRCPMEVGWAQDINSRLKNHVNNSNTTPLFGLVNAISRLPIKDGGAAFPQPMQLVLFPIWKNDEDLKRIAEILGSVLCSSYWIYGGLNYAWAGGSVNVPSYNPSGDNWMQSADHFQERIKREGGLDFARVVQLGEHSEKARERSIAKAEKEAVELEWKKKRLEVKEQRAKVRSLRAERDEKDRQRREEIRGKIAEGDEMMDDFNKIYEPTLQKRKVMETVKLLHRLSRAKARKDTEVISELEEEVAGVDADILTEAQTGLDKLQMQARLNWEGVSTGTAADPQDSGNVIDLTTK